METIRFADFVVFIYSHIDTKRYSANTKVKFARALLIAGGCPSHMVNNISNDLMYKYTNNRNLDKKLPKDIRTIPKDIIDELNGQIDRSGLYKFLYNHIDTDAKILCIIKKFVTYDAILLSRDKLIDILCTQFHEIIKTQKPVKNIVPDECIKQLDTKNTKQKIVKFNIEQPVRKVKTNFPDDIEPIDLAELLMVSYAETVNL